jgi:MFS transporter, DHA1 family, tetracycline resistance protein
MEAEIPPNGAPPSRAAVRFIGITVTLDILAMGLIIPVLPPLIIRFLDGDTAQAATIYGLFGMSWALMQFLFSPLLGALSDRVGRRPVILLSNLGLGLDYLLMALAPNLVWLFVGRLLSGVTSASISTAYAYIADVTPADRRAKAFGIIGVAFGLGFVIGPAMGGVLGSVDPHLPFWVAAVLSLANAAYGYFILPESLPVDKRSPFRWQRANPLGSLRLLRSNPELLGLSGVMMLYQLAHHALPAVFVLYAGYRYGWGPGDVGLTLALVGVCSAVVQGGMIGPVVARLGERRALVSGLIGGGAGFAIYGLAETGALFLIGAPIMALWGLAGPSAMALMSRHVSAGEQGRLQGANTSIMGLTGIVGPGLFTGIFAWAIGPFGSVASSLSPASLSGAPFLLAALLMAAAALMAFLVTRKHAVQARP